MGLFNRRYRFNRGCVDIDLFYEFAKTMLEDIESLQTDNKRALEEVGRLRQELARLQK